MTVSSTTNRKTFAGNGVTTSFATSPVVFFDTSDLVLTAVTDSTGASEALVENTDYTVTGGAGSTGTVSLAGGSSPYGAPAAGITLVIRRVLPLTQDDDFLNNDINDAEVLEDRLDRLTMIAQQLDEGNDLGVRLSSNETATDALTVLPFDRASRYLGFDASKELVALAAPTSTALTTAYSETLLAAANAAAALETLGLAAFTAQGQYLVGESSGNGVAVTHPLGGAQIINGKVSLSVGASALTAVIKGLDGNDPSAANPVLVMVPQLTSNTFNGTYSIRKITAALSVVVSSGSTLGHTSAVACPVYFYLIDNAGTLELAVSTKYFGTPAVVSTTAEGGAGGADTATVMYSTAARTNVPSCLIGRWKSTQATAGTWAAVTGEQQLYPFPFKTPKVTGYTSTGANTHTKDWDALYAVVAVQAAGGSGGGAQGTGGGQYSAGSGGGGGGYSKKKIDAASYAATETATVGAGGATATAGGNGNAGGSSSFGSHCTATGGSAGASIAPIASDTFSGTAPAGGVGSGGDVNVYGDNGEPGFVSGSSTAVKGGSGGASYFSGSVKENVITGQSNGTAGRVYGGGSSGAANGASQGAATGAAGANGIVIVTEFYS